MDETYSLFDYYTSSNGASSTSSPSQSSASEGASWSDWLQNIGTGVVNKYVDAKWVQPYETERLRLMALGQNGYYTEGQRNPVAQQVGTIGTGTLLLAGGVLLAVLLMKR